MLGISIASPSPRIRGVNHNRGAFDRDPSSLWKIERGCSSERKKGNVKKCVTHKALFSMLY